MLGISTTEPEQVLWFEKNNGRDTNRRLRKYVFYSFLLLMRKKNENNIDAIACLCIDSFRDRSLCA